MVSRPDGASGATRARLPAAGARAGRRGTAHAVRQARGDHDLPARRLAAARAPVGIAARSAQRWRRCIWPAPTTPRRGPMRLGRASWMPLLDRCRARADEVQPGLVAELDDGADRDPGGWPAGLPDGHIHADLFPDNVFFLNDTLSGVIDFYFAATDLLAYDVAVCLNAWCFEADFSFNVTKSRALLRGVPVGAAAVGGRSRRLCRCCARARRFASC